MADKTTQIFIDNLINTIWNAENPESVTNEMVARVMDFLNTAFKDCRIDIDKNKTDSGDKVSDFDNNVFGNYFSLKNTAIRLTGKADPLISVVGLNATPFLPITGRSPIKTKHLWRNQEDITPIAFYDENKNFISCYSGEWDTVNGEYEYSVEDIPEGAKYIRCTENAVRWEDGGMISGVDMASLNEAIGRLDGASVGKIELKADLHTLKTTAGLIEYIDGTEIQGTQYNGYFKINGSILSSVDYVHSVFEINPAKLYHLKISTFPQASLIEAIRCLDADDNILASYVNGNSPNVTVDGIFKFPASTDKVVVNWRSNYGPAPSLFETDERDVNLNDILKEKSSKNVVMASDNSGHFINDLGVVKANQYFHYAKFDVSDKSKQYKVSTGVGANTNIALVHYYAFDGTHLGFEYKYNTLDTGESSYKLIDAILHIPDGATYVLVNASNSYTPTLKQIGYGDSYDFAAMKEAMEKARSSAVSKLMKVHVYGQTTAPGNNLFYIRTKYNDAKDILLLYYTNGNGLISPNSAYVGSNTLTDAQLMTSTCLVSEHNDSTAPLFNADVYWHLYAQHGCPMPVINNTNGMTSADVGAIWKDQLNRHYTIGSVTSEKITLITAFESKEGWNDRAWRNTTHSTPITSLTRVTGSVTTSAITAVSGYSQVQLRPVMEVSDRRLLADGKDISQPGDYYCDEFKVSESQIGYDPSTITQWFPAPMLSNAQKMAKFTWSYNFYGAQCCVNTTIEILRKIKAQSYGGCQQQFFLDKGAYKAMFVIPKVKAQNGVVLNKPFNSPSVESSGFYFARSAAYLLDVNNPYDRQIGFLYNPTTNDYLVGMAAGLSLVSGDTTKEKRIQNIQVATDSDNHNRLGSFSPANINKFYVAAVNSYPFKDNGYFFPAGYFKEVNYYVSYFDPAENKGQIYWYKDGNCFVIYAHCQQVAKNEGINLPPFMEGLGVAVVEKTENVDLLTNRVSNGKLYVNWNTEDSNYIVLQTTEASADYLAAVKGDRGGVLDLTEMSDEEIAELRSRLGVETVTEMSPEEIAFIAEQEYQNYLNNLIP